MYIIITMAGAGSRFRKDGYDIPKYMIKAKGKTLFEWSISSLKNFRENDFIFITRKEHESRSFIEDKCRNIGINKIDIIEIDYLTKGQAETALLAKNAIKDEYLPILIYNIDTHVEESELKPSMIKGEGWIPSFKVEGERWSFVEFDNNLKVNKITEKVRISEYGTVGLYYFSSFNIFESYYKEHIFLKNKEHYIAPIYQILIDDDKEVYTHILDEDRVHVLGTPEDLEIFLS